MAATSIDPIFKNPAFQRRAESDNDSAISLSHDIAVNEKQRSLSMIELYELKPKLAWRTVLVEPVLFVLPSFISSKLRGTSTTLQRHSGVAALDGLRGIACLIVLNERVTSNYSHTYLMASNTPGLRSTPLQWPIVRMFWSGSTMAQIFFLISGYVLSYKPLRQVHRGNISDAHRFLTSSTIRRGVRLYIPTLVAIFFTAISSYLGIFDDARSTFDHHNNMFDLHEASPPRFGSFTEQMRDAGRHVLNMFDLWHKKDNKLYAGDYDLYTWAIAVEFRNSMILLLALFAMSRLRTTFRLACSLAIITFSILTQNRSVVLFLSGMLLADVDQLRLAHSRGISYSSYYHETSSKLLAVLSPRSPIYPILFVLGMFICSIPVVGAGSDPLYQYLHDLIPANYVHKTEWSRIPGSIMLVWAAANSTVLKPIFSNRVARYLGQISLALYLVHGSVLKYVLHSYIPILYQKLGDGTRQGLTDGQLVTAWLFGMASSVTLSIWIADVFWRAVDLPTIKGARWLEERVSEQDELSCHSPKRSN